MMYIVGLGNPGEEYENTRHNTGRIVLEVLRKVHNFPDWEFNKKLNAFVSKGNVLSSKVPPSSKLRRTGASQKSMVLLTPQTFMNKSGEAVKKIKDLRCKIKDKKREIENLAVIHDDLDIPFGKYKISFNKSSGGHKGVESIIKALKTQAFVRVRVGISPISPLSPILKKPRGETAVEKTILGKFTPDQLSELKKLAKRIVEGLVCLIT